MFTRRFTKIHDERCRPIVATAEDLVQTALARDVTEKDALWAAIRGLSDRQRAVVVLHYFEGLTLPQCAAVLGCSLGTVKTQLGRALTRLRVHPAVRLTRAGR